MVLKVPIDLDDISFGEYPPSKAAQVTTAFFQARQGVLQVKSISCCINQIIRAVEIETSNSKPLLATSSWILFSSSKLDAIAHACNAPVTIRIILVDRYELGSLKIKLYSSILSILPKVSIVQLVVLEMKAIEVGLLRSLLVQFVVSIPPLVVESDLADAITSLCCIDCDLSEIESVVRNVLNLAAASLGDVQFSLVLVIQRPLEELVLGSNIPGWISSAILEEGCCFNVCSLFLNVLIHSNCIEVHLLFHQFDWVYFTLLSTLSSLEKFI
ncbi:unnamed protein product [Citrullus colocynthis]|uniref:Uncharacterized protein n=1 Tax=Citrullus colocynthis TaxID=252529 RepID=A0ABP0YPT3_9ROSI